MKQKNLIFIDSVFVLTLSAQQGFIHQQSTGCVMPTDEKVLQKLDY